MPGVLQHAESQNAPGDFICRWSSQPSDFCFPRSVLSRALAKMASPPRLRRHQTSIPLLLYLLVGFVTGQSCNTNQNPYCSGVAQFEVLCCPYPNVCYWEDRDGQAACCPAGQNCNVNGGGGPNSRTQTTVS